MISSRIPAGVLLGVLPAIFSGILPERIPPGISHGIPSGICQGIPVEIPPESHLRHFPGTPIGIPPKILVGFLELQGFFQWDFSQSRDSRGIQPGTLP